MKIKTLIEIKRDARAFVAQLPEVQTKYGIGIYGKNIVLPEKISSKTSFNVKTSNVKTLVVKDLELIQKHLEIDSNKLEAFHYANLNELLVIETQKGKESQVEIKCHLTDVNHVVQLIVIAGISSENEINVNITSTNNLAFLSAQIYVIAQPNSNVKLNVIQNISPKAVANVVKKVICKNESNVVLTEFATGSANTRIRSKGIIDGSNATCEIYTTSITNGIETVDAKVTSIHQGKSTTSKLYSKAVLFDESKNIYRGNIVIPKDVTNCNGAQIQEVLLLSDKSNASAVPNLEINNNDVKCSHSSSITSLNEDKLFYLQTRGFNELDAKKLAITSFLQSNVKKMPNSMQEIALEIIENKIK